MAVITVLSGSYCHGGQIAAVLTKRLKYRLFEDFPGTVAQKHNLPEDKLRQALDATGPFSGRNEVERDQLLAQAEVDLAELIQEDNMVVHDRAGLLIPGDIAHVLRVCLIADIGYRVKQAMSTDGLSESEATSRIRDFDRDLTSCTMSLANRNAYDERLYDIVIPVDKTVPAEAVELIAAQAASDAVKPTEWSQAKARDFLLSARVKLALANAGHQVEVFSESGHVTVGVNESSLMMSRLYDKVKKAAATVEGVADVTTKPGTKIHRSSINPWEGLDVPPRILLVDDEREFVQTLSERLKSRNLESSIAYDGESALEKIEKDVPDVIVLDLLMPGIDGIETLRRVKASHPEVEVIILTGHGSDREQVQAEELGAFAYLRKPVNVNELAQVMKEAYAHRRGNR